MSKNGSQELHIELNITKQCNMRCAYCSEDGHHDSDSCEEVLPRFLNFVDRILVSNYFAHNYQTLCLVFWGGEPTLRSDLVLQIVDRYKHHSQVRFLMYSNGFHMPPKLMKTILELKDKKTQHHPKFFTQISYDGQPIHDLKRSRVLGGATAQEVRNSVEFCKANLLPFAIKSTITLDTLKYMHEAYMDVSELARGSKTHFGFGYFPTLDYLNDIKVDESLDQYVDEMRQNLKQIASSIIRGKRSGKAMLPFRWFDDTKANCSAGINMFSVNTDGNIYVCHECMYTPTKDDHLVGTVDDDLTILAASTAKHAPLMDSAPSECDTCAATFCVRCNALRYSTSDLPTYEERWKDYTNKPDLCRVYEEAGKVARAFQKLL